MHCEIACLIYAADPLGEQIRRVAKKLRYFGAEQYLQSPDWEPHITDVVQNSVYASMWPLRNENSTLWTLVN